MRVPSFLNHSVASFSQLHVNGPRRWAFIDVAALRTNAVTIDAPLDLRGDAYGHGLEIVLSSLNPREIYVSTLDDLALAKRHGFFASIPPASQEVSADETEELFLGPTGGIMTLTGEVVNVKDVPAGAHISYGYTYTTDRPSTLALVALGYADGVPRRASNIAPADIAGQRGLIAGRIAMDQLVVRLDPTELSLGTGATLFGGGAGQTPLRDWAKMLDINPLAVTSTLSARVMRIPGEEA